jgi:hypothetical protein
MQKEEAENHENEKKLNAESAAFKKKSADLGEGKY